MSAPVLSGDIPSGGIMPVLKEVEARRTSGVLRFEDGVSSGEVALVAGLLSDTQKPLPSGQDPLDVLLALREGRYEVFQRLPPLPVSHGNEATRTGSLAVHAPADLMTYCESAGLTGMLCLDRESRRAEAVYDCGELRGIRLDGSEDADLHEVFGWDEGTFEIRAEAEVPSLEEAEPAEDPMEREPTIQFKRAEPAQESFLRVVEVALSSIVEEREKRRSPDRVAPVLPPKPAASAARAKKEREATVRIVYMGTARQRSSVPPGLPHTGRSSSRDVVLADATPERRGPSIAPGALEALLTAPSSGAVVPPVPSVTGRAPGPGEDLPSTGFGRGSNRTAERKTEPIDEPVEARANETMAKKSKKKAKRAAAAKAQLDPPVTQRLEKPEAESVATAAPSGRERALASPLVTAGWVAAFVMIALAILAVLAALPPIE